jgi:hypothetical protein
MVYEFCRDEIVFWSRKSSGRLVVPWTVRVKEGKVPASFVNWERVVSESSEHDTRGLVSFVLRSLIP